MYLQFDLQDFEEERKDKWALDIIMAFEERAEKWESEDNKTV